MSIEDEIYKAKDFFGQFEEVIDAGRSIFEKIAGKDDEEIKPTTVPSPTTQSENPGTVTNPVPQTGAYPQMAQQNPLAGQSSLLIVAVVLVVLVVVARM